MNIGARFMAYAADFEQTYADDDWGRLRGHFCDDAVYEVKSPSFPCRLVGTEAIFAGMKRSVDGFDRKFDSRSISVKGAPVIKGYIKDGEAVEKVYDVACSDGLTPDMATHRCPDNGAKVNLADCSITTDIGDAEMLTLWEDPQYDADVDAFYYVRVLENPTCRWSTWDALREGVEPRAGLQKTIQERAWSSPIWVRR